MEAVLQDFRGHGRRVGFLSSILRADNFAAAYDFGGRKSGNLRGQHEVDFELRVGREHFVRLEEQSRAADVFGGAFAPILFADLAVLHRQVKLKR